MSPPSLQGEPGVLSPSLSPLTCSPKHHWTLGVSLPAQRAMLHQTSGGRDASLVTCVQKEPKGREQRTLPTRCSKQLQECFQLVEDSIPTWYNCIVCTINLCKSNFGASLARWFHRPTHFLDLPIAYSDLKPAGTAWLKKPPHLAWLKAGRLNASKKSF